VPTLIDKNYGEFLHIDTGLDNFFCIAGILYNLKPLQGRSIDRHPSIAALDVPLPSKDQNEPQPWRNRPKLLETQFFVDARGN
jgi:hypothetical protein